MPWRQFILLCLLVVSIALHFVGPFRNTTYIATIEVEEGVGTVSDSEYPVLTLSAKRIGKEFSGLSTIRKLCSEHFFMLRYGGEEYIGFYLSILDKDTSSQHLLPLLFPKKGFIVLPYQYGDISPPTVEFNNGSIILRIHKVDLERATCFKNRILV